MDKTIIKNMKPFQIHRTAPIILHENMFIGTDGISNKVQILRVGNFFHEGQTIVIDKSHLKSMVKNFKDQVRGVDLMLDYSHETDKEAAAWFKDLYLSEDGKQLWADVHWTDDGSIAVLKKKYRYISADFQFSYKDNENQKDYGPTLFGAALTNRPVVKNMEPTIELSEIKEKSDKTKDIIMEEKIKELEAKIAELEAEKKVMADELSEKSKLAESEENKEKEKELSEREDRIKLAEEKIEADKKLAAKKSVFDKMLSEGKTVEAQRVHYMADDFVKFAENSAQVNLSEKGSSTAKGNKEFEKSETPAQDEVISLSEKKMSENKDLDLDTAQNMVLSENKDLNLRYIKETQE